MLKVGLTGSIAVGKSTVCEIFRELGCHILDADQTARDVVEPRTEGLEKVIEHFGEGVLKSDGSLDRAALGNIVFADKAKLEILNSIIHPLVFRAQNDWIKSLENTDPKGIAIVDAALMIESGGYKRFNKLIVVWCNADIQVARLMKRDGFSKEEARRRIDSQMPQEEKKKFADFLIDTSGSVDETHRQTLDVYEQLKLLTG